jgi:hypothetical protein
LGIGDIGENMIDISDALKSKLLLQQAILNRRFIFDGKSRGNYLLSVPQMSKDANLTAGAASIKASNCDRVWNIFLQDKLNLGKNVSLEIEVEMDITWEIDKTWNDLEIETWNTIDDIWTGLGDESWNSLEGTWDDYDAEDECWGVSSDIWENSIPFFTGSVEDIAFDDASVSLKVRDKMAALLDIRLGSGQEPVGFYDTEYNPADLVWAILTEYGYLDDTESSDNVDIDYDSWAAWWTDCDTLDYAVKARFTGQTIKNALLSIKDMTVSYIWISGEGRLKFKRPIPPYLAEVGLAFTPATCKNIDTSIDKDNLCNEVFCYYGYDPDTDIWEDNYYIDDPASQEGYGVVSQIFEDKTVWHVNEASAKGFADRFIEINRDPVETIDATIMAMGYLAEVGDINTVSEDLKEYSEVPGRVLKISYDLKNGTVKVVMQNIGNEQLAAFYLDDAYYGLLDQSYNPLL